ncbi:hypothetical protein OG402_41480 [Streptomyces anulatus]|nr:hypothetical protein [Streptomyces anulatus]MCX4523714.1 hypothetical protein [Streptomyces anulatus]MCX4606903.1 hypothetical protein [Streptomyces anulatus]WTD30789.1 hypothetical protein OH737_39090 [Streptomyces anulatus]WTE08728.1 hypothetical protein OH765_38935 [Streptomyces anulatus]
MRSADGLGDPVGGEEADAPDVGGQYEDASISVVKNETYRPDSVVGRMSFRRNHRRTHRRR